MAFSLNKVMLIGNLGQDAEHRFTTNNTEITSFSVATTYGYKNRDGEWVNETTWHNVIAFSLSDFFKNALKKGRKVYIEGRISKRNYENKDGQKVYVTEIIADRNGIIPLDSRDDTGSSFSSSSSTPAINDAPATAEDDDLPF
ncbi:single-stranded DNA-binding protein [bacterium BMS3Abin04]|nr:single-stranded DNA-binding protein [bacterium BMS3Abin04]